MVRYSAKEAIDKLEATGFKLTDSRHYPGMGNISTNIYEKGDVSIDIVYSTEYSNMNSAYAEIFCYFKHEQIAASVANEITLHEHFMYNFDFNTIIDTVCGNKPILNEFNRISTEKTLEVLND